MTDNYFIVPILSSAFILFPGTVHELELLESELCFAQVCVVFFSSVRIACRGPFDPTASSLFPLGFPLWLAEVAGWQLPHCPFQGSQGLIDSNFRPHRPSGGVNVAPSLIGLAAVTDIVDVSTYPTCADFFATICSNPSTYDLRSLAARRASCHGGSTRYIIM